MTHDNSQPDIANHHSLTANLEPRVSYSKEIGEATITHTIFGRAKVRISRKYDNLRRALLLFVMVAIAAVGWQVWLTMQPAATLQSADSITPAEAKLPVPIPQPENVAPVTPAPAVEIPPVNPSAAVIAKPASMPKSVPQPQQNLNPAGQAAPRPTLAVKPQPAPLTVSKTPAPLQPVKPLPVSQPAVPVAATPRPLAQAAASSPAAIVPLASPLGRSATPSTAPAAAASAPAGLPAAMKSGTGQAR